MRLRFGDWLDAFRGLHEKHERGELPPDSGQAYREEREEFLRALAAIQQLTLQPGQIARRQVRVSRAVQIELDSDGAKSYGIALDLSSGGFATLLDRAPAVGSELGYSLRLSKGGAIAGRARVVDAKPTQGGSFRVSAAFLDLPDAHRERLEDFILNTVLARLRG